MLLKLHLSTKNYDLELQSQLLSYWSSLNQALPFNDIIFYLFA